MEQLQSLPDSIKSVKTVTSTESSSHQSILDTPTRSLPADTPITSYGSSMSEMYTPTKPRFNFDASSSKYRSLDVTSLHGSMASSRDSGNETMNASQSYESLSPHPSRSSSSYYELNRPRDVIPATTGNGKVNTGLLLSDTTTTPVNTSSLSRRSPEFNSSNVSRDISHVTTSGPRDRNHPISRLRVPAKVTLGVRGKPDVTQSGAIAYTRNSDQSNWFEPATTRPISVPNSFRYHAHTASHRIAKDDESIARSKFVNDKYRYGIASHLNRMQPPTSLDIRKQSLGLLTNNYSVNCKTSSNHHNIMYDARIPMSTTRPLTPPTPGSSNTLLDHSHSTPLDLSPIPDRYLEKSLPPFPQAPLPQPSVSRETLVDRVRAALDTALNGCRPLETPHRRRNSFTITRHHQASSASCSPPPRPPPPSSSTLTRTTSFDQYEPTTLPWNDSSLKRSMRRRHKRRPVSMYVRRTTYSDTDTDTDNDDAGDTVPRRMDSVFESSLSEDESLYNADHGDDDDLLPPRTCVSQPPSKDGSKLKKNVATINPFQMKKLLSSNSFLDGDSEVNEDKYNTDLEGPPLYRQHRNLAMDHSSIRGVHTFDMDDWRLRHRNSLLQQSISADQSFSTQGYGEHLNNIKSSADSIIREKDRIIEKQQYTIHQMKKTSLGGMNHDNEKLQMKLSQCEYELLKVKETKDEKIIEMEFIIKDLKGKLTESERNMNYYKQKFDSIFSDRQKALIRLSDLDSSIGSESPTASNTYQSSAEKIREMERRLDEAQSLHEDMNRSHTDSCLKRKIEAKSQDLLIATLENKLRDQNDEDSVQEWTHKYHNVKANLNFTKKCFQTSQSHLKKTHETCDKLRTDLLKECDAVQYLQEEIVNFNCKFQENECHVKKLGSENNYLIEQHMKVLTMVQKGDVSEEYRKIQWSIKIELDTTIQMIENIVDQFSNIINRKDVDISSLIAVPDYDSDNEQLPTNTLDDIKKRLADVRRVRITIDAIRQTIASRYADNLVENTDSCITQ